MTALVQVSTREPPHDYIIDSLRLWHDMGRLLRKSFASPRILKVFHAMGGLDVPCLHRDFGIVVVRGHSRVSTGMDIRVAFIGCQ